MSTIYADESGFTGSDLLSEEQPFFVAATVLASDAEIGAWLTGLAKATASPELKFVKLVKSGKGRAAILDFVTSVDSKQGCFLAQLVHKRYALLGKLLDCAVEPMFHANNADFYRDGFNLALLNLLYLSAAQLAPAQLDSLLRAWLAVCRDGTQDSVKALRHSAEDLAKSHGIFAKLCEPLLDAMKWRRRAGWTDIDKADLELQTTSVVSLVRQWNEETTGPLTVLADQSKELRAAIDLIAALSDPRGPHVEVRGSGRVMGYPLRIKDVRLCDSAVTPGVQVADVFAGIVNHVAITLTQPARRIEGFSDRLAKVVGEWPRVQHVYPQAKFTPEELDRVGFDGAALVDAGTDRIADALRRKRASDA